MYVDFASSSPFKFVPKLITSILISILFKFKSIWPLKIISILAHVVGVVLLSVNLEFTSASKCFNAETSVISEYVIFYLCFLLVWDAFFTYYYTARFRGLCMRSSVFRIIIQMVPTGI